MVQIGERIRRVRAPDLAHRAPPRQAEQAPGEQDVGWRHLTDRGPESGRVNVGVGSRRPGPRSRATIRTDCVAVEVPVACSALALQPLARGSSVGAVRGEGRPVGRGRL